MASRLLGRNTTLAYSTTLFSQASGYLQGSPNPVLRARDFTCDLSRDQIDATDIESAQEGYVAFEDGLANATISFDMTVVNGEQVYQDFANAYFNSTALGVAVILGGASEAGALGVCGNFKVTGFNLSSQLKDLATVNVTLSPNRYVHTYTVPQPTST